MRKSLSDFECCAPEFAQRLEVLTGKSDAAPNGRREPKLRCGIDVIEMRDDRSRCIPQMKCKTVFTEPEKSVEPCCHLVLQWITASILCTILGSSLDRRCWCELRSVLQRLFVDRQILDVTD